MSKKWYNLFVSVDESSGRPAESEATPPTPTAADAVADIARSVGPTGPPPTFAASVSNSLSFAEIYQAAEIHPPSHGFTIEKVGDMLRSEHIRTMPRDVKKKAPFNRKGEAGKDLIRAVFGVDAIAEDPLL